MSNSQLEIIAHPDEPLLQPVKEILASIFQGYSQITVKEPFSTGLSGSQVFPVRPIHPHKTELPIVFKFDKKDQITKEWDAYKKYIEYQLPNNASIRGEPHYTADGLYGGLCYELVGSNIFEIQSFATYYDKHDTSDVEHVLKMLQTSIMPLWQQNKRTQAEMLLQRQYDSFLPVNLWLKALRPIVGAAVVHTYQPDNCRARVYQIGDYVAVSGFVVAEIEENGVLLNSPAGEHRLKLEGVAIADYVVGQHLDEPITAVVQKTRVSFLQAQVKKALPNFDPTAVALPGHPDLKNPLIVLPQLLKYSFDVYVGRIHGDLNLQNILVNTDSRSAYLIDFALSRPDHILRDLLHLEMSIVTRLVSEHFVRQGLPAEAIVPFYHQLHTAVLQPNAVSAPVGLEKPFAILKAIRQIASHQLYKQGDWREYFCGLFVYLVGCLRYHSLDAVPLAKELAFWAAAVTHQLISTPPTFVGPPSARKTADSGEPGDGRQPQLGNSPQTNISGPVHGDVYSGITYINKSPHPHPSPGPASYPRPFTTDNYAAYERGAETLVAKLTKGTSEHAEALNLQSRLKENISRVRRYGDTDARRADRNEIIDYLNSLALSTLGTTFNELC